MSCDMTSEKEHDNIQMNQMLFDNNLMPLHRSNLYSIPFHLEQDRNKFFMMRQDAIRWIREVRIKLTSVLTSCFKTSSIVFLY